MNYSKYTQQKELIKQIGKSLKVSEFTAKKIFYGYVVKESDKSKIFNLLTGEKLEEVEL